MTNVSGSPRQRAKALAARGGRGGELLIIPLAFELAARIQERPLLEFLGDPTQLANGLLELFEAIGADGIVCALDRAMEYEALEGAQYELEVLLRGRRVAAALEATRRLRATLGDQAALVAGLTGPATLVEQRGETGTQALAQAGQLIGALARQFCEAGADIIIVFETAAAADLQQWQASLRTLANIVRFYQGLIFLMGQEGPLPPPTITSLGAQRAGASGVVVTPEEVPPDTSIDLLRSWVDSLRTGAG